MARILLVDDEPSIRALISDVLTSRGHIVRHTPLTREAIWWLKTPMALAEFDLVITDLIRDHDGGDGAGWILLEKARQVGYTGPVLLFTGVTEYENDPSPFDGALTKPTELDEFVRWVESFLNP